MDSICCGVRNFRVHVKVAVVFVRLEEFKI